MLNVTESSLAFYGYYKIILINNFFAISHFALAIVAMALRRKLAALEGPREPIFVHRWFTAVFGICTKFFTWWHNSDLLTDGVNFAFGPHEQLQKLPSPLRALQSYERLKAAEEEVALVGDRLVAEKVALVITGPGQVCLCVSRWRAALLRRIPHQGKVQQQFLATVHGDEAQDDGQVMYRSHRPEVSI